MSFEKFSDLDLHELILQSLEKKGYKEPSPIQKECLPHLLEGRDLLGIAKTGSGKTAAFALPILDAIGKTKRKPRPARFRALILTPTRELATQIQESCKSYAKGLALSGFPVTGGSSINEQIKKLGKGLDILIATPGRLLELMELEHVLFEDLEYFVLDEADRMLDMGFFTAVNTIIEKLPAKRQTLLFSATMPKEIEELSKSLLNDPIKVEIQEEEDRFGSIKQSVMMVHRTNKPELLKSLLKKHSFKSVIVFVRTKKGAERLTKTLEDADVSVGAIHGDKSQGARDWAIRNFKKKKLQVLVATDVAARGIDIEGVTQVINYQLPEDVDSYIHRIGRTGRAGAKGEAIALCDEMDLGLLKKIEYWTKQEIEVDENQPFHGKPANFKKGQTQNKNRPKKKRLTPKKK